MRFFAYSFTLVNLLISTRAFASEAIAEPSTGMSMFKVLLGLLVVLALLVGFAWCMKKIGLNQLNQQAVAKVVGGVSVGHREKVVVVEVANRWLVVGVSASQVTHLANLDPIENSLATDTKQHMSQPAFTEWLQKAIKKNPTK